MSGLKRRWTDQDDEVLLEAVVRRHAVLTKAEVRRLSRQLGRMESAVTSRVAVLRRRLEVIQRPPDGSLVTRACLSCGTRFQAPGRFIRVCHGCKAQDAWRAGA